MAASPDGQRVNIPVPDRAAKRGRRTGTAACRRNCRLKREGRRPRGKSRGGAEARQYPGASAEGTARGRRLPRKAAKLQARSARTGNRHRWSRRVSKGARVSHIGSVLAKPAAVRFLEGFLMHYLTVRKIFNTTIILILQMIKQKHREENLVTCPL